MTLSDAQSWVLIITAVGGVIIGVLNAWNVNAIKDTTEQSKATGEKTHELVNSAMAVEKAKSALLETLLAGKQMELESAEKTRLALAQAQALAQAAAAAVQPPPGPSPAPTPEPPRIVTP